MRIPKEFQLMGHTIKIRYDRDEWLDELEAIGKWDHEKNEIWIHTKTEGTYREQTFLHEVRHAILYLLSYLKLHGDEKFVDQDAQLWHQFLTSQKY